MMPETADETVLLTADEAIAMLPDGDSIHTFRSGSCLVGVDWDRERLVDEIRNARQRELGGEQCCAMNHGLVVWTEDSPLFVSCREGMDYDAIADEAEDNGRRDKELRSSAEQRR